MSRNRNGNVVLEPLPATAVMAQEAREHMAVLEKLVTREGFVRNGVTVRCYNNEVMSREYARELFHLITVEYGVPKARFISPSLDGAAHLFDAANDAGKPDALVVFTVDDARSGCLPCPVEGVGHEPLHDPEHASNVFPRCGGTAQDRAP